MTVKRVTFLQELLTFMGLGGRLHLAWISSAEAQKFASVVTEFTDHIRTLGPNPLKDYMSINQIKVSQSYENNRQTLVGRGRN
jgi:F420-non-reducing hydrogenase iron-sulfur subunit